MAVCGVVLLIVCANVANLLLARTTARHKEFGLRMALGAGRVRLVRQLLTESLVLAVMGALAGAPLAMWMAQSLGYLLPRQRISDRDGSADEWRYLGVHHAAVCGGVCVVGHGARAATARADLNDTLKAGGRSGSGSGSRNLRGVLVVSEVALALVAIIGAGLFAKSFQIARQIHPGFDPQSHAGLQPVAFVAAGYSVPDRKQFCFRLRERLESQPGIVGVSLRGLHSAGVRQRLVGGTGHRRLCTGPQ